MRKFKVLVVFVTCIIILWFISTNLITNPCTVKPGFVDPCTVKPGFDDEESTACSKDLRPHGYGFDPIEKRCKLYYGSGSCNSCFTPSPFKDLTECQKKCEVE